MERLQTAESFAVFFREVGDVCERHYQAEDEIIRRD